LDGRLERPVIDIRGYYFNKARGEIKDGELEKETINPNGIEGLSHVERNRACQSPFDEVSCDSTRWAS
jgi:hypothetical protein